MFLLTALLAGAAGYFTYASLVADKADLPRPAPPAEPAGPADKTLIGQTRPDYTLGSSDGSFVSASDFDGRVVLVNFWATWCAPCREEMPMLMALRERFHAKGFEVVGIALDDVERARAFAGELGINYPILVGSTDVMATLRLYGNATGALPYSVLVDRKGKIRWNRMGVLERESLEPEIDSLIGES